MHLPTVVRRTATLLAMAMAAVAFAAAPAAAQPRDVAPLVAGCGVHIDNIHVSTHNRTTVNVEARASCTARVPHIALFITIRANGSYAGSNAVDVYGTNFVQSNASAACHQWLHYRATAVAEIWFNTGGPQWTNVVNSPALDFPIC